MASSPSEPGQEFQFAIAAGALPSNAGFLAYDGSGTLASDFVAMMAADEPATSDEPFEQQSPTDPSYPDITNPGVDTSNFPNSPYTLPKGRSYVENTPLGLYGDSTYLPSSYCWAFMLRYGVTDYLEFRIFSSGLTVQDEPDPVTGFYPLAFDLKLHCWEENRDYCLPAVGLELYLLTDLGTSALSSGTQPSLSLLFDQEVIWEIDFSYNVGIAGVENEFQQTAYQLSFDWAFERDVTECLSIFVQGFYNNLARARPTLVGVAPADAVIPSQNIVGLGGTWTISRRIAAWASYNFGTASNSPKTIAIVGFGVAF